MNNDGDLLKRIWEVSPQTFTDTALEVYRFQYMQNDLYRKYSDLLKKNPGNVLKITNVPFLPIQFFKTKKICTTVFDEALVFESSGTTGAVNSRHFVKDIAVYEKSFLTNFTARYGIADDICIIGLLPSYLERKHSSLVYMVNALVNLSKQEDSGFYLYDHQKLKAVLEKNEQKEIPTVLIGVTYALLDFAEANTMNLRHTIVMETGGMKGRREELPRRKVHDIIKEKLGLVTVHSEYGMTELLSQAYSAGKGIFYSAPWMKILVRKEDDPFDIFEQPVPNAAYAAGAINIVDLANLYSCSFIATDDAGKIYNDSSFEVTGRLDNSDIRGCGLMIL